MNSPAGLESSASTHGARKAWSRERGVDGGFMTEREAVAAAMRGGTAERFSIGARALGRLLMNVDDTVQVLILGVVVNASHAPEMVRRFSSSPGGAELLAERPTIDSRSVDFARLRALPADTLGGAYARYLDDNKLDPDLFQAPPGLPEPLGYIAQRIRQTHDVWHVLTGYRPDVPGELALQGFTYAQLGAPSALLIAALGTLTKSPRSARSVLDGYRRGKSAVFLPVVRFEKMWELPLAEVQRRLGVRPARVAQRSTERMAIAG